VPDKLQQQRVDLRVVPFEASHIRVYELVRN